MRYLYELEIITGKNVISKKKDKKEEKEKNEAKSKKEGEKKLAAIKEEKKKKEEELKEKKRQALENAIENQKKIVEDLKKQYDLWFNLTYSNDKEKYKYKDVKYSSQLMYYYEDKLKAAQERLEKLEKELEALK
jgi:predicted RNase H-like nuclease (RuvC/YqgF family)